MKQIESAERAVLCVVFREYPDAFVWIGGSVLQLLHGSPRASYDLDLSPRQHVLAQAEIIELVSVAKLGCGACSEPRP